MSEYVIECDYYVDEGLLPGEVREEIVRCRDRKFRCFDECTRIDEGFKDYWFAIEPDGFCAWGARRDA